MKFSTKPLTEITKIDLIIKLYQHKTHNSKHKTLIPSYIFFFFLIHESFVANTVAAGCRIFTGKIPVA